MKSKELKGQADYLKFKIEMRFIVGKEEVAKAKKEIARLKEEARLEKQKEGPEVVVSPVDLVKRLSKKQRDDIVDRHEAGRPTDGGGADLNSWRSFMHHLVEDVTGVNVENWSATKCDNFWRRCTGEVVTRGLKD